MPETIDKTVRVDREVHEVLWNERGANDGSLNDVLRRKLSID